MHETDTGESRITRLLPAPRLERIRPLPGPVERIDVLATSNDAAVDDSRHEGRELSGRHRHHRLVQEGQPLGDSPVAQRRLPLDEPGKADEVGISKPLADAGSIRRRGLRPAEVARGETLPRRGQHQISLFGTIQALVVDETLRPRQPSGSGSFLAGRVQTRAEPERRARGGRRRSGLEMRVVRALERPEKIFVPAQQARRQSEPIEILARKRRRPTRRRERLEGRRKVVTPVGFPTSGEIPSGLAPAGVSPFHGPSVFFFFR